MVAINSLDGEPHTTISLVLYYSFVYIWSELVDRARQSLVASSNDLRFYYSFLWSLV